jgi:hypothetical protein
MYETRRIVKRDEFNKPFTEWGIVNIYEEFIFNANGTIIFKIELDAQTFCDRINVCSDGGIITNFI